jgi:pimeloyl-ACP methyl ester carboxylesterase
MIMAKVIFGNHAAIFVPPGLPMAHTKSDKRTGKMTMAYALSLALASMAAAASPALEARSAELGAVKNIVLVHGAATDGSGWRGVYDILRKDGYQVRVVQEPLTGLSDDVAATQRVIDQQDGPVILAGHSYGGTIITVAGADPKVRALVYVAALQPDIGETANQLAASMPGDIPASDIKLTKDGFLYVDPSKYAAGVGTDLPPALADFMANSQMPVAAAAFNAPVSAAAWHSKPSYGIVATEDRTLNPELARWMYKRSGAKITEIKANHLVYISQPSAVASVIETAARSGGENTAKAQ